MNLRKINMIMQSIKENEEKTEKLTKQLNNSKKVLKMELEFNSDIETLKSKMEWINKDLENLKDAENHRNKLIKMLEEELGK